MPVQQINEIDLRQGGLKLRLYRCSMSGVTLAIVVTPNTVVKFNVLVPTLGSDDSGEPHCLEHLIFRGSASYPHVGILDTVANMSLSGSTNAYTMTDRTVYTLECGHESGIIQVLPVYLDHILRPTLTELSIKSEVYHVNEFGHPTGVVFSEMESALSDAASIAFYEISKLLYGPECQYRHNTGGHPNRLTEITRGKLHDYHDRFYKPESILISIIGNVNPECITAAVDAYIAPRYTSINSSVKQSHSSRVTGSAPSSEKTVEATYPAESAADTQYKIIGYRCGKFQDVHSWTACTMLAKYLAEGSSSVFRQELIDIESPVAVDVEYELLEFGHPSLYFSFTEASSGFSNKYERLMDNLLGTDTAFDLERLRIILTQQLQKGDHMIQNNPYKALSERIHGWWLYDDSSTLTEPDSVLYLSEKTVLEKLCNEGASYWVGILRKFFSNADMMCLDLRPDAAAGETRRKNLEDFVTRNITKGELLENERDAEAVAGKTRSFNAINDLVHANGKSNSEFYILDRIVEKFEHKPFPSLNYYPKNETEFSTIVLSLVAKTSKASTLKDFLTRIPEYEFALDALEAACDRPASMCADELVDHLPLFDKYLDMLLAKIEDEDEDEDDEDENMSDTSVRSQDSSDDDECTMIANEICLQIVRYFLENLSPGYLLSVLSRLYFESRIDYLDSTGSINIMEVEELELLLKKHFIEYACFQGNDELSSMNEVLSFRFTFANSEVDGCIPLIIRSIKNIRIEPDTMIQALRRELSSLQEELRTGDQASPWLLYHSAINCNSSSLLFESPFVQQILLKTIISYSEIFVGVLSAFTKCVHTDMVINTPGSLSGFFFGPEAVVSHSKHVISDNLLSEARPELTDCLMPISNVCSQLPITPPCHLLVKNDASSVAQVYIRTRYTPLLLTKLVGEPNMDKVMDLESFSIFQYTAPLQILEEYYRSSEGPVFQAVRDIGASYGGGILFESELREIVFYLNECSELDTAMNVGLQNLHKLLVEQPSHRAFEAARSAALFTVIRDIDNPLSLAEKMANAHIKKIDMTSELDAISRVTYDDFIELNYIVVADLLNFNISDVVIVGPPTQLDKVVNLESIAHSLKSTFKTHEYASAIISFPFHDLNDSRIKLLQSFNKLSYSHISAILDWESDCCSEQDSDSE